METFKVKINSKKANIYFLGDVHEGNCNFDEVAFKKAIKIIENDPDGYWFCMGDAIDAITHYDTKRFDPSTISTKYRLKDLKNLPIIQMDNFYENVKPIKDKCIGLVIGNHEASYAKYNGCDVYRYLLKKMSDGDPVREKELCLGYVALGKIALCQEQAVGLKSYASWTLALNHGDGGGGYLPGYPVSKVYEMFRYYMTDINVMGHIHQLYGDSGKYLDYMDNNDMIEKKRRIFGVSGTFLTTYVDGNANYFEGKGRKEGDIGMLKIELSYRRSGNLSEKSAIPIKITLN